VRKVGDGELVGKLAYTRLKQIGQGDLRLSMSSDLETIKSPKDRTTMNNFHLLRERMVMTKGMQESQSHVETLLSSV
jgi:hypothetical protein